LKDVNAAECYEKILVPLDGSQRAEITLPIATSFAQNCGAQLVLAHVVHRPEMPRHAPPNVEEMELVERIVALNQTEAARYLENIASRLGGDVETRLLVSNNIAASLHQLVEQERIDLVVLSAHGYSGEPQWPYGSVTSHLIAYSKTPVLVVQDLPAAAPQSSEKPAVARSGKATNA
jgi:nucleotide-binding universal stress UspA family protein